MFKIERNLVFSFESLEYCKLTKKSILMNEICMKIDNLELNNSN